MAQSRDEVRTELINRTEYIEGYEKEMLLHLHCVWPPLQLLRLHKHPQLLLLLFFFYCPWYSVPKGGEIKQIV